MVGNAIGDALGGAVEFFSAERLKQKIGKLWVDDFYPYDPDFEVHPLGVWRRGPPRGTGTDDTRNNHILAECVVRNGGVINSQFLAIEYIQRYRDRATFYPGYEELAEQNYCGHYRRACAHLGMRELPEAPGPPGAEYGNAFPSLSGLINLAFAGLLFRGEPEKAYLKAFALAYFDVGYARDCTAMLAAMVSAALGGPLAAKEMLRVGLTTDPFGYGKQRYTARVLEKLFRIADEATDDRALVDALSRELQWRHPYDAAEVLGFPLASIRYCDGDPVRSILLSANDRELDGSGQVRRLRDVDCVAGVAGALVGALRGVDAFPRDWVRDVQAANKEVYGIDIPRNARRLCEVVHGSP